MERVGVGRTLAGDGEDERAREAITPSEKLLDRRVARAITALHRNGRVERKQGDREIAEWRWREQVAAATEGTSPANDSLASAWYRREVVGVHLRRLLTAQV